jgi:gamma-glutamylcyclotransferase (GGCT)/AIG2-like uncharacterized protein YtfP
MKRLLYFAYGSNLSIERLTFRVGDVGVFKTHVLEGWELYFSGTGFANIRPREGATVEGVLYEMTPTQHKSLDRCEGFYVKEYFTVGEDIAAVYIEEENNFFKSFGGSLPTASYLNFIIEGALFFGLERTAMEVDAFKKANLKLKAFKNFDFNGGGKRKRKRK